MSKQEIEIGKAAREKLVSGINVFILKMGKYFPLKMELLLQKKLKE